MPSRRVEIWFLTVVVIGGRLLAPAQASSVAGGTQAEPQFEAVTIKHPDPAAQYHKAGFYGTPGGRVFLGVNVRMLVEYAFDLRDFQVVGGPDWGKRRLVDFGLVRHQCCASGFFGIAQNSGCECRADE